MGNGINLILTLVAIGGFALFATFFIILGLNKNIIWEEIGKIQLSNEGKEKNEANNKINDK